MAIFVLVLFLIQIDSIVLEFNLWTNLANHVIEIVVNCSYFIFGMENELIFDFNSSLSFQLRIVKANQKQLIDKFDDI